MNKKTAVLLSWLCVVVTMIMIFCFSAEDAKKSTTTSTEVIENILGIIMDKEEITPQVVQKYQFPFRKAAHFGIYMLLGFCLANAYRVTFPKMKYLSYVMALPTAALYAVSDEFHQKFTAGRYPSVKDILIDTSGALFGILIFFCVYIFLNFLISKRNKNRPKD